MFKIIEAAVNRPRTTLLLMAMIVISGLIARNGIPIESDPQVDVPWFAITILHEGISPEDAERMLIMPMEKELRQVEAIKEMSSFGSENAGTIMLEFDAGYDMDLAQQDAREAVDRAKAELPNEAEEPILQEMSPTDYPTIHVNLNGDVPERMLYNIALDLRDQIEALPDILEAELVGAREELLEIEIDPLELEAYQLLPEQLINTVLRNNRLIPAGNLDGGKGSFSVKVPGIIEDYRDLFNLPLKTDGNRVITLEDVAKIRRTFKDKTGYGRVNGENTMILRVKKRIGANDIETSQAVRNIVESARPALPSKVNLFYSQDVAPMSLQTVNELEGNLLTALGLVMIIVVAAMGMRSGVIVGLGIPVSFLFAMIFITQFGFTYNFMVIFGMLLGLGMLIDGAIVVTEYADRKMTEGAGRKEAYLTASRRMFWPVTASTATTLAVFLPLMAWPGVSGQFMRYLPVTVFCVLSGSLLYALVLGPTIGAIFGKAGRSSPEAVRQQNILDNGDPKTLSGFTGLYAKLLGFCAKNSVGVLFLTFAILVTTFWSYGQYGAGVIYFNAGEVDQGQITIRARGNYSVEEIKDILVEVESKVLDVKGIKNIDAYTQSGGDMSPNGSNDKVAGIFLQLHERHLRAQSSSEIFEEIRRRTDAIPGIEVEVRADDMGPPVFKDIQIEIASYNRDLLDPAVEKIVTHIQNEVSQIRDLEDSRALPGIELRFAVDREQAALYNADVTQVGIAIQLITNGIKVGEYRPSRADDAVDIRVRYPKEERGLLAFEKLKVATGSGMVPMSNFVKLEPSPRITTMERRDGIPVKNIRANVETGVIPDTKVKEIESWVKQQNWHPDLQIRFRGANEEQNESIEFVGAAFGLSLLLMFVLMVTQFNSFYQSALVLFAVVLSTAGVFIGLLVTGNAFSAILTGTGIVALAGIVVNNNIVLIDTYNSLKRENPAADYMEVIIRTGAQRLRPVLLTTITTVCGLIPLANNVSVDLINREIQQGGMMSSFWTPLTQAIACGLTFATVLTLVTTPAMLAIPHQFRAVLSKFGRGKKTPRKKILESSPASGG